jgi:hypothetical protein
MKLYKKSITKDFRSIIHKKVLNFININLVLLFINLQDRVNVARLLPAEWRLGSLGGRPIKALRPFSFFNFGGSSFLM